MTSKFISDEVVSVVSKSWVFSVAPKIISALPTDPYKGMDQNQSSFQLRLMPYSSEGGGVRSVFNISWPQMDSIRIAVDMAMCGLVQTWDLADAYGDTMTRVFGAEDAQGYCPARVLVLKRQPLMPDGTKARLPWYVEIKNGKAKKKATASGGAYMVGSSFVEESKCQARLTDGQMKDITFWANYLLENTNSWVKTSMLQGHQQLEDQKMAYRKSMQAQSRASQ